MKHVLMPALGVTMAEGLLVRWLKQPGDVVGIGDVIAELETDKATLEVESEAAGILSDHRYSVGDLVPPGSVIADIMEDEDLPTEVPPPLSGGSPDENRAMDIETTTTPSGSVAPESRPVSPSARVPHSESPRKRRALREGLSVDPTPSSSRDPLPSIWVPGRHRPLIASKVSDAWRSIPHFAVVREIDAELLGNARTRLASQDEVTITDLLVRAVALTLLDTGYAGPFDVGLAVATRDGVVIPTLPDILDLSLAGLAKKRAETVARARSGRLTSDDLNRAAVITLSNLGALGIDLFTGVIALGQPLLLTVGRLAARPAIAEGQVVAHQSMFVTLNVDHRAFDGEHAARFLSAFAKVCLDAPRLYGEAKAA